MSNDTHRVTFVLTGPRKGYTGILGGRYGFRDGKLEVDEHLKDKLKIILCNRYCCNVEGEAPLWKTVNGGAVKITDVELPEPEVSVVSAPPKAELKVESGTKAPDTKTPETKAKE